MPVFRKIHTFRGESAFSTWLLRLAVNHVLMCLRRKSLPAVSLDEPHDPNEASGPSAIDLGSRDSILEGSLGPPQSGALHKAFADRLARHICFT